MTITKRGFYTVIATDKAWAKADVLIKMGLDVVLTIERTEVETLIDTSKGDSK